MTSTPQETETQHPPPPPSPKAEYQEAETQQVPPPPPPPKADQEAEFHEPTSSATVTEESQPNDHPPALDEKPKKWGTHIMGPAAAPNVHPDNQQAALWNASEHQQIPEHPYLVYTPIDKSEKSTQKSFEPVIHKFQEWGKKAETVARNMWHNLSTGPSVPQSAWGKVNLTAKAITEGGFESLFKQIFETDPNEKLKKTFACYLSTSTGPVAGTLYLSTARVAFCSDRPLCHTAPSGEEAWSYYKMTGTPQETETQQVPPPPPSPKADQEAEFHEPTSSATVTEESHPKDHPPASDEKTKKWGTHIMGPPAAPNFHPDNQQAALWNASEHQQIPEHPYLVYTPIDKSEKSTQKSFEPVIHKFQEWGKMAETVARNIWHNLSTGPSVPQAAWGKVNLTVKAMTEGGFESLFKHIFETTDPNEKLKKSFACYLSTSTGPVAGTLYLSTARVAFCSDRPLCHTAPSGEEAWSYYKVMIPLEKISRVSSETMLENPPRKYIQLVSTDGHDFWFMGFVNFEKALQNLSESVSSFKEAGIAIQPIFENGVAFGYIF
ncbi:hypothetical protein NC652_009427 [Populus alba x Populus x berolinensis]|nr:hypothetical protein NC652_009427 [Populus alba x Populus x berolinensis]